MTLSDWIGFLCLIIALAILWEFRGVLLLVFMAVVLAIALNSLVRWFHRRWCLPRGQAIAATLVTLVLGGGIVAALILPPFIEQVIELGDLIPKGLAAVGTWQQTVDTTDWGRQLPDWFPPVPELLEELQLPAVGDVVQQTSRIMQQIFDNFLAFFSSTAAILLQVLLVTILTLMLLVDPQSYRKLLIRLFPSFYRRRADEILVQCEQVLLSWMRGVCLSSIFVAIACAIGLLFLRVDLVFAHALLAGLFNIIPNIGPTLSLVFPMSVALIDSPGKAIGVVGLYLLVQNLESYWFSPMVMRQQVSMLPAATLIAQLFFATFLGPVGLVLALPLAVVAKVWIEEAVVMDILDAWHQSPFRMEARSTIAADSDLATTVEPRPEDRPLEEEPEDRAGSTATDTVTHTATTDTLPSPDAPASTEPAPHSPSSPRATEEGEKTDE